MGTKWLKLKYLDFNVPVPAALDRGLNHILLYRPLFLADDFYEKEMTETLGAFSTLESPPSRARNVSKEGQENPPKGHCSLGQSCRFIRR